MDWIKFGWGDKFQQEFDKSLHYYVDASARIISNKSLIEIANRVISDITKKYPPPYYLMVSGGLDSQAMLWCWLNSNVPFQAISFRYTGATNFKTYLNDHDLVELDKFCNANDINVEYHNFDIISFLENDLEKYAVKYQCTSPQICTHMRLSELVPNGTVIFSGNFLRDFHYDYTILGLKRYANKSLRNIIPFFFLHDSELANITLQLRSTKQNYDSKIEFYEGLAVPVIPQPNKQTGFEIIKDYYDTRNDLIISPKERIRYSSKPSKRKFDILFRYRYHDLIPYQDRLVIIR
jgi:hypothetical protein